MAALAASMAACATTVSTTSAKPTHSVTASPFSTGATPTVPVLKDEPMTGTGGAPTGISVHKGEEVTIECVSGSLYEVYGPDGNSGFIPKDAVASPVPAIAKKIATCGSGAPPKTS